MCLQYDAEFHVATVKESSESEFDFDFFLPLGCEISSGISESHETKTPHLLSLLFWCQFWKIKRGEPFKDLQQDVLSVGRHGMTSLSRVSASASDLSP